MAVCIVPTAHEAKNVVMLCYLLMSKISSVVPKTQNAKIAKCAAVCAHCLAWPLAAPRRLNRHVGGDVNLHGESGSGPDVSSVDALLAAMTDGFACRVPMAGRTTNGLAARTAMMAKVYEAASRADSHR